MKISGLLELEAVVAVATHRNFRRAASELGLSPSALSHSISGLEQRLGVRLFHRTTRSVSLSEVGEQFLARVRPALRDISEAMDGVNEFRSTPKGTLRINSHERAARMILPSILRFLEHYPEMKLDLVTEGRLIDIVAEGFDAGIRLEESVPKDMIAVRCSPPLRFAVVGAPAYFKSRPRPKVPADLYTHECLKGRMPSGAPYQWDFEKRGEQQVIDVSGRILLDNHNIMLDAVLEGAGLGYMTEWLVEPGLKSGRLVRVLEDWTPPLSCLCVYYPSHRHPSAGLRAFIEFMREAFTD